MNPVPVRQSASFVRVAGRAGYRLVSEPDGTARRGTIVAVHAFAEEMNKTRRMCARMARLAAGQGWRVVQRDLAGCGDSSGDFADATWAAWIDDVREEVDRVAVDEPLWLWCVRAGALLAGPALEGRPDGSLLLWQPVLSGAQHLQQFLRLQAGARIVGKPDATSPAAPARGDAPLEVAGYEIAPALADGMRAATFDVPADHASRLVWFEVAPDDPRGLSPAAARVVERLTSRDVRVDAEVIQGPPFWQTQEIEECDALLARSLTQLGAPCAVRSIPVTP